MQSEKQTQTIKMQILDQYKIQFSGLTNGVYNFNFQITNSFFEATSFPEVESGDIAVLIKLEKSENLMVLDFQLDGGLELMCDRCLEYFTYPVSIAEQLIVRQVADAKESEDDNLLFIELQAHTLDLSQFLYDYINIALPIQRIHPEDEQGKSSCNQEMLDQIEKYSKPINNSQWDALKDFNTDVN